MAEMVQAGPEPQVDSNPSTLHLFFDIYGHPSESKTLDVHAKPQ